MPVVLGPYPVEEEYSRIHPFRGEAVERLRREGGRETGVLRHLHSIGYTVMILYMVTRKK